MATSAFFAARRARNEARARLEAERKHRALISDRNTFIALACVDGGLALGGAALSIRVSFALIALAAIFAALAVSTQRRADAIRPRSIAADLAEGGDVQMAEAA